MKHFAKSTAVIVAAFALAAAGSSAIAGKKNPKHKGHYHFHHHHHDHKHGRSLRLEAQGSYYVGGEIVTIPSRVASGTPQPGEISINHAYV